MKQSRPRIEPMALAVEVRGAIQNGAFAPGQRLVEIDLMERYGVSRNCARRALQDLESQGIVSIVKNQGAFVRRITREEVLQILDVLDELDALAIRLVVAALDDRDVHNAIAGALKGSLRFQSKLDRSMPLRSYVEETNRVWNVITATARNIILEETHAQLQALLHRVRLTGFMFHGQENRWVSWHVRMLEAILEGDAITATKLMRTSAKESRAAIMALPDEAFG